MYEALSALGSVVLDPYLLFLIFATTVIGIVIGVLPGLGNHWCSAFAPVYVNNGPCSRDRCSCYHLCLCNICRFDNSNIDQYSWHLCSSSDNF